MLSFISIEKDYSLYRKLNILWLIIDKEKVKLAINKLLDD